VIDYVSGSGGRTLREISEIQLIGGNLYALCELRHADREFNVSRIQSVIPAP
jgi:predicted DNA-binding transcriptional regulator YafY